MNETMDQLMNETMDQLMNETIVINDERNDERNYSA